MQRQDLPVPHLNTYDPSANNETMSLTIMNVTISMMKTVVEKADGADDG